MATIGGLAYALNRIAIVLCAAVAVAACGPHASNRPVEPGAAIEQDIAAARGSEHYVVSPVPAPTEAAATPSPAALPPQPPGKLPGVHGTPLAGSALRSDPRIGHGFALDNCRPCHVVAADQGSPVRFANAPDFLVIANDPHTTPLDLRIWLTNPHPTMPSLRLTSAEAANVIAYIMSLRR